jgi:hypothetical protein
MLVMLWWLLIIVPILVFGVIILIILGLTFTKMWIHRIRAHSAQRAAEAAKLDPDGVPYPPAGRGLCDECERAFERVFYLQSGRRICEDCYEKSRRTGAVAGAGE